MTIGYTIHDRGECRPCNGAPPEIDARVRCHRGPVQVIDVGERATPPIGFDRYYDVHTKPI
jgi:hypothetical protein